MSRNFLLIRELAKERRKVEIKELKLQITALSTAVLILKKVG